MKVKKTIHNFEINGVPYLLPVGQGIMAHEKGLATNEIGIALWEMLKQGKRQEELLEYMMKQFEASEEERPLLQKDLNDYLTNLKNHGFFDAPLYEPEPADPVRHVQIGPLSMSLRIPEKVFQDYFSAFHDPVRQADDDADQTITFCRHFPPSYPIGLVLVRSDEVLIMEAEELYVILPLKGCHVHEIHCSKDGSFAKIYGWYEETESCHEELFAALRFPFLILAQQKKLCVMHSASLLYRDKAFLFSGTSGVGKSTHVKLWQDTFGTSWINGDLNLLGIKNGQAVCYGLPWCGTSGISTPGEFPLGGITFLKKAPYNKVTGLAPEQFILLLAQRMITPNWNAAMMQESLSTAEKLASRILGFRLECTKDPEAAYTMKSAIDTALTC